MRAGAPPATAPTPGPVIAGSVPGKTIYTCPMHPQIRQDHSGDGPICGMALEPEVATAVAADEDDAGLLDMTRRSIRRPGSPVSGSIRFGVFLLCCVLPAHAQQAPMSGMKPHNPSSEAAGMTDMMGAPGLVPYEIMTGQAGRWMVGYQFMVRRLDGMLDGTHRVSEASVLDNFATTPTDMTMRMHMGMVMYAPTDKLTFMAMLPYIRMSMGELHREATRSTERSEGIGDLELRSLYSLYSAERLRHRILVNFGVGIPTGSINARDAEGSRMEYPMQVGSGTFSLLPGLTYLGQLVPWGWAAGVYATVPSGRNDVGYRVGNHFEATATIARQLPDWLSVSAGARAELWGNTHGLDPLLDPTDEPTKDPNLQGGRQLSAELGITFHPQKGLLKNQHLHVLGELPIAQSLDGPQLQGRWVMRLGWQLEF